MFQACPRHRRCVHYEQGSGCAGTPGACQYARIEGRLRSHPGYSGNANCATKSGDKVAAETTKALAKLLKTPKPGLSASTGVIGVELDGESDPLEVADHGR